MSYTVLVVDDHKFAVSIMEYHLMQNGYQVLKAYDGNLALQVARQSESKINLIITDLHMPKMNGIELANALKKSKIAIPIILVTSDVDVETQFDKDRRFQVFDGLLIKPISATQMFNKINYLVQNNKMTKFSYK